MAGIQRSPIRSGIAAALATRCLSRAAFAKHLARLKLFTPLKTVSYFMARLLLIFPLYRKVWKK